MKVVNVVDESFAEYKKPHMLVGFPSCTFKCDRENGSQVCQNWELAKARKIDVDPEDIVARYLANDLTEAVVFAGLEPFDSFDDVLALVKAFRAYTTDPIVIYTGYREHENPTMEYRTMCLREYENIIVKFGRYRPGQKSHYDEVLGVELASDNQYGKKIS